MSVAPPVTAIGVGTPVEARYGGEDAWLPGVVTKVHDTNQGQSENQASHFPPGGDSEYSITYDDGEEESSVASSLVRAAVPPPTPSSL